MSTKISSRQFSPYEQTFLARCGKPNLRLSSDNTTPVEYLCKRVEFAQRWWYVDRSVLIPRVETEELLDFILADLPVTKKLTIADIGCGSGVIGLNLWLRNPFCHQIWLSDISDMAVAVTRQNASLHQIQWGSELAAANQNQVSIVKSDLLAAYPNNSIDVLVANLPYIPSFRIKNLDKSVIDHEPHLALDGGSDGLTLIQHLLQQATLKLKENGVVWLEIDYLHTLDDFEKYGYTGKIYSDYQQYGRFAKLKPSITS